MAHLADVLKAISELSSVDRAGLLDALKSEEASLRAFAKETTGFAAGIGKHAKTVAKINAAAGKKFAAEIAAYEKTVAAFHRKARTGRPGSIRGEARARGVTEAFIRKERAHAKGKSTAQSRGHARYDLGETGLQLEKDFAKYHEMTPGNQEKFLRRLQTAAKKQGITAHQLWSMLLASPGVKK
jgi:hypothetical protein